MPTNVVLTNANQCHGLGGFPGWHWLVLVGIGWCWLVLVGIGWHWLVLVGVGWRRMASVVTNKMWNVALSHPMCEVGGGMVLATVNAVPLQQLSSPHPMFEAAGVMEDQL